MIFPHKEILVNALLEYPGTIIFVSHDHDFVNNLATHILELTPDGLYRYEGNYDSYLYQKKMSAEPEQTSVSVKKESAPEKAQKNNFETQKKIKSLEAKIEKTEKEIAGLEASFADIAYGSNPFYQASQRLQRLKKELAEFISQWEELTADS